MKLIDETWDEGGEPINLAQPRPHTFLDKVQCVVDRERGTVTFGTYADALRSRFNSTKRPPAGRCSRK